MEFNRPYLNIDLAALRANYDALKSRLTHGTDLACAVKANGYGLGIEQISTPLYGFGARHFFVANGTEAEALRDTLPADASIYVFNGHCDARDNIIPVLNSLEQIRDTTGKAVLHFDTSMNRLGIPHHDAVQIFDDPSLIAHLDIKLVMSHFSSADLVDHPATPRQAERFAQIAQHFPNAPKSLANSAGTMRSTDYHYDMVRCGMALYGLNPTPETTNPMQRVVTLGAPILDIYTRPADEHVGYCETYKFEHNQICATIGVGYGDGLPWSLGNSGAFYVNGYRCPIRGRVSMDLTVIDLSAIPDDLRPKIGDHVEIIGAHQTPAMIAADAGALDYEILTSLGHRYRRRYA